MLKALMLRSKLDKKNKELKALLAKREDLNKREAELEQAITEAAAVEGEEGKEAEETLEAEVEAHQKAKEELDAEQKTLEEDIAGLESELKDVEAEQERTAPQAGTPETRTAENHPETERREIKTMIRNRYADMSFEERTAFVQREEVAGFLSQVRQLAGVAVKEHRDVTGGALLIPEVMLPLIKTTTEEYSKLVKHVYKVTLTGTGRQNIMGEIPEAVWTECCANLNNLALTFTEKEIDCYKVAGYIPVCNATLEDADIDLAGEIINVIGQSIGYALDKAIVFGTGTKMPVGFVTNMPAGNKTSLANKTGDAFFKAFLKGMKNAKHGSGDLVWVMNEATKLDIMAEGLTINAAGAIVSGVNNTMPVVGGVIETLDFVADGEFYGGYGARYLLGERKGIQLRASEEYKFIEDQTVFKGTARYDGKPVFDDAFVGFGLNGAPSGAIDANHPFAADAANTVANAGE